MTTEEIRRLALELDPIVDSAPAYDPDVPVRLSEVVRLHGWRLVELLPEVRRFLDRLGAMVAESEKYTADYVSKAVEFHAESTRRKHAEIERLKGAAHGFVDEITERDYKILGLEARIENAEDMANRYRAALESAEAVLAQTIEDRDLWEQRWREADAENTRRAIRERDDAREAGKALQEYSRKQRARIEKALGLLNELRWADGKDSAYGAAIRAALTGEEAE